MDKSLLVAVFVPTKNTAATNGQGCHRNLGTGYPVGPDLILTARHLFHPDRPCSRDPSKPIEVGWHYCRRDKDPKNGWIDIRDEDIVWSGTDKLDVVLLHCPRLPGVGDGYGKVSEKMPDDGMK